MISGRKILDMELKIDIKKLEELKDRIKKFTQGDKIKLCEAIAKEIAMNLLRRIKQKTPVQTGNLRRNWNNSGEKIKNGYQETVFNQTEYAAYVEYGHRKPKSKGWVPGRYMLTKSEKEVGDLYQAIAEKHVDKAMERLFGGK